MAATRPQPFKIMAIQIQMRRGIASLWTSEDPTLANGEFGYEDDTGKLKIGDGATAWTSLDYFGFPGTGTVTSVATSNGTFIDVTGGTITTSGTITGDLSATGTASLTTFLRGDNTWAVPSGGGGASLTVQEVDGTPSVSSVDTIIVSNGTLTDDGSGQITLTTGGGSSGLSSFTVSVDGGDNFTVNSSDTDMNFQSVDGSIIVTEPASPTNTVDLSISASAYDTAKLAIVPALKGGFIEFYCTEATEVWFEDVLTVATNGQELLSVNLDAQFVAACEPGSIKATGHSCTRPIPVGIMVDESGKTLEIEIASPAEMEVTIKLSGIRKGFKSQRMEPRTEAEASANSSFWKSWRENV
jgi:hypothetical protein